MIVNFLTPRLGDAHPNNHLLADYFTGWFIHNQFSVLVAKDVSFAQYEQKFQQELLNQYYPDGGNFEHAMHYHEHGSEMVMIFCLLSDKSNIEQVVLKRIKRIMQFQLKLMSDENCAWELGDTTEDTLLPLDNSTGWSLGTLKQVYQHYFGKGVELTNRQVLTHKAFWLLNCQAKLTENRIEKRSKYTS